MIYLVLPAILSAMILITYIAVGVLLALRYVRTRERAFAWLGVAVVVWPLISLLLEQGWKAAIARSVDGRPLSFFPFNLVEHGSVSIGLLYEIGHGVEQLIGVAFLLIAGICLFNLKTQHHQGQQA